MKDNRLLRNHFIQREYKLIYAQGFRHTEICRELADIFFLGTDYVADVVNMVLPDLSPSQEGELQRKIAVRKEHELRKMRNGLKLVHELDKMQSKLDELRSNFGTEFDQSSQQKELFPGGVK